MLSFDLIFEMATETASDSRESIVIKLVLIYTGYKKIPRDKKKSNSVMIATFILSSFPIPTFLTRKFGHLWTLHLCPENGL